MSDRKPLRGRKLPEVEVHFNVNKKLFKQFERALLKSGFSTKSEFFRSKMRELVDQSRESEKR